MIIIFGILVLLSTGYVVLGQSPPYNNIWQPKWDEDRGDVGALLGLGWIIFLIVWVILG